MPDTLTNIQNYFTALFTKKSLLFYIVLFYTCLFFLPKQFKSSFSLDNQFSAYLGSQEAFLQGLRFGETYISTYGPLAFLKGRLNPYWGSMPIILLDTLTIALTLYLLFKVRPLLQHSKHLLLVLLPTAFISVFYDIAYIYYLYFILALFLGISYRDFIPWLIAGILAILVFLIQVQPGILMLLLFQLGLYIHFPLRKALIHSVVHLLGLLLVCFLFNVHLLKYTLVGLKLIIHHRLAFSQIDYTGGYENYIPFIAITALLFWGMIGSYVFRFTKQLLNSRSSSLLLVSMLISLYLLHVQTFTHITPFNVSYLFFYGLLLLMIYALFIEPQQGKEYFHKIIIYLSFLSILFSTAIGFSPNPVTLPYQDLVFESPVIRELRKQQTLAQIPIDSSLITSLRRKTIDVFPNEIAHLHYTNLNYSPRPISQAQYNYLPELYSYNQKFYQSNQAPDCVLVNLPSDSVPVQYDASTFLGILQHYSTDTILDKHLLLLSKRAIPLDKVIISEQETTLSNQTAFSLSSETSIVQIATLLEYTLLGHLYQFVFQPPRINCTLITTTSEGSKRKKQVMLTPLQLANGILVTPFSTTHELINYLHNTVSSSESTMTLSYNELFYQKTFHITSQKVALQ